MQPTLLTGLRCSHRSPLCQDPEYGETSILAIEPVALKKELKNASGALADVWRKTLAKTSHGKHLNLFRQKIESRCAQSFPVDPLVSTWGVERRGEFSPLGPRAGCFLALGFGLGLVGTASSRR